MIQKQRKAGWPNSLPRCPSFDPLPLVLHNLLDTLHNILQQTRINPFPNRFESRSTGQLDLKLFLTRLIKYARIDLEDLLTALILIDRLQSRQQNSLITESSVRGLLVCGLLISGKLNKDQFISNATMGKVSGLGLPQLNRLQECFLREVQFRVLVLGEEVEEYRGRLLVG